MSLKPEKLTKKQKNETVERLFAESAPRFDFFLMLLLSAMVVSLGLLLDNTPIVIGGMLLAPLLFPVLTLAMGIVVGDGKLIKRSGIVLFESIVVVVFLAFVFSLFWSDKQINNEIISRAYPNLGYFLVALFSGVAVAYSVSRPGASEVVPGVAIAVALIPPLAVIGVAISFFKANIILGAISLFGLNLLGVIFGALLVFALFRFYETKESIEKNIKKEEKEVKEIKKEKQKEDIVALEETVKEATEVLKDKQIKK